MFIVLRIKRLLSINHLFFVYCHTVYYVNADNRTLIIGASDILEIEINENFVRPSERNAFSGLNFQLYLYILNGFDSKTFKIFS